MLNRCSKRRPRLTEKRARSLQRLARLAYANASDWEGSGFKSLDDDLESTGYLAGCQYAEALLAWCKAKENRNA